MARNQSEKLVSCPSAYAYMQGCEEWIEDRNRAGTAMATLWGMIPYGVSGKILRTCGYLPTYYKDEMAWRLKVIAFIRGTYAP